jgi:hypothetical protein
LLPDEEEHLGRKVVERKERQYSNAEIPSQRILPRDLAVRTSRKWNMPTTLLMHSAQLL